MYSLRYRTNDVVSGMKHLLAEGGVIAMESPHLYQLVVNNPCDTIYHEHFSYLSFLTVSRILAGFGLKMFAVENGLLMADHCGSSPVMN